MASYSLAVDIGGTFTDVVLRDGSGRTWTDKTLTTHGDLLDGFFRAVDLGLARAGGTPAEVDDVIVHATTIVTNAIIERKGPPVALLVTEGFADVLVIRDEYRYDMYDPQIRVRGPVGSAGAHLRDSRARPRRRDHRDNGGSERGPGARAASPGARGSLRRRFAFSTRTRCPTTSARSGTSWPRLFRKWISRSRPKSRLKCASICARPRRS